MSDISDWIDDDFDKLARILNLEKWEKESIIEAAKNDHNRPVLNWIKMVLVSEAGNSVNRET